MIDYFFKNGTAHDICEDYICHDENSLFLSDGCSSASNTDIGSRILSLVARKNFKDYWITNLEFSLDDILNKTIFDAEVIINSLSVRIEALFTTLIIAKTVKDSKYISLSFIGDGSAALVKHDGTIRVYDIEFNRNAPKYLAYRLSESYSTDFHSILGNNRITTIFDLKDGEKTNSKIEIEYNHLGYPDVKTFIIDKSEFKNAIIFSDGIKSFLTPDEKNIPVEEIITKLVDFKCITENFVKRRVNKFYKDISKDGISHYDDLSIAALHLG